jgi:hypothetical protein
MMQLLEFYSMLLLLCPKLISASSIPTSALLSHASVPKYSHAFVSFSSLMSFSNVLHIHMFCSGLYLFLNKFLHMFLIHNSYQCLLIAFTIFNSFSKSSSLLPSSFVVVSVIVLRCVKGYLFSFLTLALDGGQWSTSCPGCYPRGKNPSTH